VHLSDRAYAQLKRLILSRPIGADEALSERSLASQLSMSRVPVREAIKALESEGILVVLPRRGIHVRRLTIAQVQELYEIREALEGMAARLCAERGNRETMRTYRRRLERLAQGRPIDHAAIQRSSAVFHRTLFQLCGNAQLRDMYRAIEPQIALNLRLTALHARDRIEQAVHEHIAVAKAIEAGDGRRAELLTQRHMQNGKRARIRILRAKARERAVEGIA
jgi:DNA-binding GntR family transcriptional regulator